MYLGIRAVTKLGVVDETFTELKPVETFAQEFETVAEWGSGTVELADGNVLTGHNLVSFASLDDTYQLNLVYDSERANLESYFLEVERSTDSTELDEYRLVTNVTVEGINLEGQEVQTLSVGVDAGEFGLVKGDTIWQLQPDDDNDSSEYTATAAVELDLSKYQTGLYPEVLNVLNVQHKNKPNCDIISHVFDFNLLITMLYPFPKLVKSILRDLPKNDYPVLNTNKFVSCWLGYSLDKSLTSMRDLFQRLNYAGINMHISTFSKASKQRSLEPFIKIYQKLNDKIESKEAEKGYLICPIDSTIVTLTSKLLLNNGYGQVKLISGLNLSTGVTEDNLVNFGYDHDYKYGQEMIDALPRNGVAVMDRGFASLDFMKKSSGKNKYFVIRIPCNYKLEFVENAELTKVGTGQKSGAYRVVNFGDLEKHTEYRLVTNLPIRGEGRITNEEIGEIYRRRWGIECLWKFLKMHLKLDKLITKNVNGISIQIYSTLIAYLIIKLVEIPEEWGVSLLDKLRFLQACMCREISYIHWFRKIVFF